MLKNLFLSLTCTMLFAAAPGFAQADLKATVPFDFQAGKKMLPAGEYVIDIDNSGLVWINRDDGRGRIVVGSIPIGGGLPDHDSKLVFHRYGDNYFLAEVWVETQSVGRMFRRTPREADLAHNRGREQLTLLAAQR